MEHQLHRVINEQALQELQSVALPSTGWSTTPSGTRANPVRWHKAPVPRPARSTSQATTPGSGGTARTNRAASSGNDHRVTNLAKQWGSGGTSSRRANLQSRSAQRIDAGTPGGEIIHRRHLQHGDAKTLETFDDAAAFTAGQRESPEAPDRRVLHFDQFLGGWIATPLIERFQ